MSRREKKKIHTNNRWKIETEYQFAIIIKNLLCWLLRRFACYTYHLFINKINFFFCRLIKVYQHSHDTVFFFFQFYSNYIRIFIFRSKSNFLIILISWSINDLSYLRFYRFLFKLLIKIQILHFWCHINNLIFLNIFTRSTKFYFCQIIDHRPSPPEKRLNNAGWWVKCND